jgi:hypothetical protein
MATKAVAKKKPVKKRAPAKMAPAAKAEFSETFARLRGVLVPYAKELVVQQDDAASYYLDTKLIAPNKKPVFFGAVRNGKAYVSFHLMPVYVFPELLEGISPELAKRMQGKSCFNFKRIDEVGIRELSGLTKKAFGKFKSAGMIG